MVTYHFFSCRFELSNKFLFVNKYGPILSVEQKTIVGNVTLASNRDYNHGAIISILYMGIHKVLLLLNEHGDPSFLFQNLSSYNINNQ